ncbi:MAG: NTP transferase domain-containing protein [Armatimonadetes bacterium]|nr:NTP transferase domain-containing protein [Armatimonadota bacterium]
MGGKEAGAEAIDALVLAGGRISGLFARAAGTTIKALVPVRGSPVIRRVVEALQCASGIDRVCAVGPDAVRDVLGDRCLWQKDTGSAPGNLRAGIERLAGDDTRRILVCASDLPAIDAAFVQDFLQRAPREADVCVPAIRKAAFVATFPGNLGIYIRLAEGAFTGGGQLLIRPRAVLDNMPLVQGLFSNRKTQIGMARALGAGLVWKLFTRRLAVGEIEARVSALTRCYCRAVLDCHAELAFDIDNLLDLRYAERWLARHG